MNPKDIYIQPITKVHTTFAEAKEFFDKFGGLAIFEDEEITAIDGLAQGNRSLIVGEPGSAKPFFCKKSISIWKLKARPLFSLAYETMMPCSK